MAVWSKALPLTASCLSSGSNLNGHEETLPLTRVKAVVFAWFSGFLHQLQLASHDVPAIWQKK